MRLLVFLLLAHLSLAQRTDRIAHYTHLIAQQGYQYPHLAAAISAVETGYWNPKVGIVRAHNLFAFKRNSRKNYIAVRASGYVVFESDSACLADYGQYEQQVIRKYTLTSAERFRRHLIRRFSSDPNYGRKLQHALTATKHCFR